MSTLNTNKEFRNHNMPWEDVYGYTQAVRNGYTIWISGQLGHDESGQLLEGMEAQMRQSYKNIAAILTAFDAQIDDIVEEVIYVTDMASGFDARKILGKQFYPDAKRIASTIVGVTELALKGQTVEIKIVAKQNG